MDLVFFVDRCLESTYFINPLKESGVCVELHRDHFPDNIEDEVWIEQVAQTGWIALTADTAMKSKPQEKQAIRNAKARVLRLHQKTGLPLRELAVNFVNTYFLIENFVRAHSAPWLASLNRPSDTKPGMPGTVRMIDLGCLSEVS